MSTVLDTLRQERASLVDEIEGLMQGDFDPESKELVEARGKAEGLDSKIKTLVDWNSRRAAANEIDAISVRNHQSREEKQTRQAESLSIGEAWTRSKQYSDYLATPKGNSGIVNLSFDAVQTRAPILTTTFSGLIQPDRIAPSTPPAQQTPLLDLISRVRVSSNSVEWIFFPASNPAGTVTAEGQPKTEAAVTPSLKTVTLDTIASWAQYSRQFGEDAPALVDFLNASLARGLLDKREALAAAQLVGSSDIPTVTNTGGTLVAGIRRAVAAVQQAGYRPIAAALNPQDYASIDLSVMTSTLRGPTVNGEYWGVQIIPVPSIASGTAYVGDFSTAMVELVRSEVSVYTTDSDITGAGSTAASAFRQNILTTLVECRTKPIVHRGEALAKVAGTVALAAEAESAPAKK